MSRFKPGDRVIYVPLIAEGNAHHPDCESGQVSSNGQIGNVFVKFDKEVKKFGWEGTTSQSCNESDLVRETPNY